MKASWKGRQRPRPFGRLVRSGFKWLFNNKGTALFDPSALLLRVGGEIVTNLLCEHRTVHQGERLSHNIVGLKKCYAPSDPLQSFATLPQVPSGGVLLFLGKPVDLLVSVADPFLIPVRKPAAQCNRHRAARGEGKPRKIKL